MTNSMDTMDSTNTNTNMYTLAHLYGSSLISDTVRYIAQSVAREVWCVQPPNVQTNLENLGQPNREFQRPLVLGILKGSYMFMADLSRQLHWELPGFDIGFITAESYHDATESSGHCAFVAATFPAVADRIVVLVDDIFDTGITINTLRDHCIALGAKAVITCTLLYKPNKCPNGGITQPDVYGFVCPDVFVVGYGMGKGEEHRHIPYICQIVTNTD